MSKPKMVQLYKETVVVLDAYLAEKSNPESPLYGKTNLTADVNAFLVASVRPLLPKNALVPKPPPPPPPAPPPPPRVGPTRTFTIDASTPPITVVGQPYKFTTCHTDWCPAHKHREEPWCYCKGYYPND